MIQKPVWVKLTGVLAAIPLLCITTPLSPAAPAVSDPLGAIVTSGHATIGDSTAPTGSTFFPGDRVTSDEPALVKLASGGRIEMTKAAASFDRQSESLLIQADRGLFRFSFHRGEAVRIDAGPYRFVTSGDSDNAGELGLNRRGQIAMNLLEGAFTVLDTDDGQKTEVSAGRPFAVMDQTGKGYIATRSRILKDDSLTLEQNELKGKCVVAGAEAYAILGNSATDIRINGNWKLRSGDYIYHIVDCVEEAMIRAGASQGAAKNAAITAVFGVPPTPETHGLRNAVIIAGVGGAVALPLALKLLKEEDKSPSSR